MDRKSPRLQSDRATGRFVSAVCDNAVTVTGSLSLLRIAGVTGLCMLVALPLLAWGGPLGLLGGARGWEDQSTQGFPPSVLTPDLGEGNVVANFSVGIQPVGVGYDSGNGNIYVANSLSNTVSVINGTTVLETVPVGNHPVGVGYDRGNGYVYVTNEPDNTVSVINETTVVETVPVRGAAVGVGYDSGNGNIYVANIGSNNVSVISGTTVVATVPVGTNPFGVEYDSGNGYVYVTNLGANSVSVISGTIVVATIPVGTNPLGVGYDSRNGNIYVANSLSNTVSVISTTTSVPFDYSLSNSGPVTIQQGMSGSVTVIATLTSDTRQLPVTLSCVSSSLPSGISCASFTVNPVTTSSPGATSDLKVIAASSIDAGSYSFQVTGSPLGATTTPTTVSVTVTAPPPPAVDYSLFVNPASASIVAGSSISATVTATLTSGTAQPVVLLLSASPNPTVCQTSAGAIPCGTINFSPGSIEPTTTGATSSLTISTTTVLPPGTLTLTIKGSPAGSSFSAATFTLTITALPVSTVSCGHNASCSVQSNATLSDIRFAGVTVHVQADGPSGAHGYANMTAPKSDIPNLNQLHVFVDNSRLSSSAVTITSNSTDYFIYFTFTFHSPVLIDIQLSSPENAATQNILGLEPTVFYGIVSGIVAILVVVGAVAYRASKHRTRTVGIPCQ